MSLTRAEWEEMWNRVIRMEAFVKRTSVSAPVKVEIDWIKDKIQQVIGQME